MLNKMKARQALLAAASHIRANPKSYNFFKGHVPASEDGHGCMVAWAVYFAGGTEGLYCPLEDTCEIFGNEDWHMYHEMSRSTLGATTSHKKAALALRRYAEKHFPHFDIYEPSTPVWVALRDREAQGRLNAQPAYDKFRKGLSLEHVPEAPPGNAVPSNEPAEEDEVL